MEARKNDKEPRLLTDEALETVSGGMMDLRAGGVPAKQQHVPGRLVADESEYGTMAGAGL